MKRVGMVAKFAGPKTVGVVVATIGVTVAALCVPGAIGVAAAAACSSKGAVVIVAGTNDPDGVAMTAARDKYRAEGYDVVDAKYPTTLWPAGAVGYDEDVRKGRAATGKAISGYRGSGGDGCANAPIKVVGYSQGARVAGDVLSDIGNGRALDVNDTPDDPSDDVVVDDEGVSGELYSDPRQDGTVEARGIEQALVGIIPGLTMTGAREGGFGTVADDVVSVCNKGDAICDMPDPVRDPIGALDGLLGYFTKHGLYPSGFGQSPQEWAGGNCHDAGSGGTICIREDDSAFIGLVKQFAGQLGIPASVVNGIPDVVDLRPRVPGEFLPGLSISKLQPLIRLVQDRLPQLPNLTHHAGGYLPDVFVFQNIAEGILTLDGGKFSTGATELAKSMASIALIPVNGTLYWSKRLVGVGPGPFYITPGSKTTSTLAATSAGAGSDGAPSTLRTSVTRALTTLTEPDTSDDVPATAAAPVGSDTATDPTEPSGTDGVGDTTSGSQTPPPGKGFQLQLTPPWTKGDSADGDSAGDSGQKSHRPFSWRRGRHGQSGSTSGDQGSSGGDSTGGGNSGDGNSGDGGAGDGGSAGGDSSGGGSASGGGE